MILRGHQCTLVQTFEKFEDLGTYMYVKEKSSNPTASYKDVKIRSSRSDEGSLLNVL
jgi:threonine synthase